ncbi:FAD-containing oxidoreductase [Aquincola sp. J276]|uniref:FAD-containing oxidoreductase n=1 Tax=Aquincola sp. J276 TaxID=2898432 RepID=UPI002150CF24|nr:FAD-containing oxidoreductase [Aquincola sp. J276]MCR5869026.1 FAD-containing oxidoreductase [Aquincola sp. J276]
MSKRFDAIVIGTGQAGPALATRLAAAGQQVAIIERHRFGGTCVNTGCMPTKAMVASAHAAHLARRAADFGVRIDGTVQVDMKAVKARKDKVARDASRGVEHSLRDQPGCTVVQGHARFVSPTAVAVDGQTLEAPRIFINVGGRAVVPDLPGIDSVRCLTNSSILELDELPRHLVVIGGSYIALEFAQMFRRFGAQVTVLEKSPRLLGREDEDVSQAIADILRAEGIVLRTGAQRLRLRPAEGDPASTGSIVVGLDDAGGAHEVLASHVLLATGRRPNTDDLGLEAAGVATDERGYIRVDDELRTSVPGIWALGDCNGRGAFTHTAYNDYEIVADNLLSGAGRRVSDRIDCYALYTDPPLGRVGLGEAQARQAGHAVRVATRPMSRVGRAVEKGETQGFMKLVVDADTDAILGAAVLGVGGDEAIHAVIDAMAAGGTALRLQRTMHIHPTVAELLPTLAGALQPAA